MLLLVYTCRFQQSILMVVFSFMLSTPSIVDRGFVVRGYETPSVMESGIEGFYSKFTIFDVYHTFAE